MGVPLTGISSMATRAVLAELAQAWEARGGWPVRIESVGGVDAARRVEAGEAFDAVVLAAGAIDALVESGRVLPDSRVDLVHSGVAVAVPAGAPHPDLGTEAAVRAAVIAAPAIGYSTGPSGVALLRLFERWGIAEGLGGRLVQAPPGVPVASMVADGRVALGFQQLSELLHVPGIEIVGGLPDPIRIDTTFRAGVCTASSRPADARALLAFLAGPEAADVKRRHGMTPA